MRDCWKTARLDGLLLWPYKKAILLAPAAAHCFCGDQPFAFDRGFFRHVLCSHDHGLSVFPCGEKPHGTPVCHVAR